MAMSTQSDGHPLDLFDEPSPTIADATLKFWRRSQKSHWHPVQGISMWPFLKHGDQVLVSPNLEKLTVGDVVVVRFPRRILVHRIVKMNGKNEIITWGDFNLHPDPAATRNQVVGKVLKIERNHQTFSLGRGYKLWGFMILWGRLGLLPAIYLIRSLMRIRNRLQTLIVRELK